MRLGRQWHSRQLDQPGAYDEVRTWIKNLTDQEWRLAIPRNSKLPQQACAFCGESLSARLCQDNSAPGGVVGTPPAVDIR